MITPGTKRMRSSEIRRTHTLQDVMIVELGHTMKLADILFLRSEIFPEAKHIKRRIIDSDRLF